MRPSRGPPNIVAPANRLSFTVDVTPGTGMHVYAPGEHGYQVILLGLTAPHILRSHELTYPPSKLYRFEPPDIGALASEPGATLRVEAVLAYQACDPARPEDVASRPALRKPQSFPKRQDPPPPSPSITTGA